MKQELMNSGAKLNGWIKIDHFDNEGNLIETVETPNALTNTGFAEVAGLFCSDQSGSYTAFDYIAVGTGTTAATATDTELETEETENGLTRAASTGTLETENVTDDTAQFVKSFDVTGSVAVTESGVFNDSSAGTMLCRQTFSEINVADGDTLQITWRTTVA
ncbi:MAG: hypothetical protein ACOC5T_09975 [Elusimicrobiota bacterium]